jgi:phage tail sheath gpL-like
MAVSTAFGPTRVARGVAIETDYIPTVGSTPKYRPVRIAVVGVGQQSKTFAFTPVDITRLSDVSDTFGYKCPLYQAVKMLKPPVGTGVGDIPITVFPVAIGASHAQAVGSIAVNGATVTTSVQTYTIKAGDHEVDVTLAVGDGNTAFITKFVAAAALVLDYPLIVTDGTTVATCTVGWEGSTGNDVDISVVSPDDAELTFTIVQPASGAGTIDIDDALEQFGDTWYSHVINCEVSDTGNYNKYSVANEARWDAGVYKPFKVYHGTAETSVATAAAITDARKSDRTNSLKPVPGSLNFAWEIAARHVQAIAKVADVNAPRDYGSQMLTLLDDGAGSQWSEADGEFQYAVSRGLSTTKIKNDVLRIADSVMMYHPDGEDPPAYRYDCDIEKICAMIYNIDLIFNNDDVDGSPLPPDDAVVTNPSARKPMSYKSKLFQLYDAMERDAIIADADFAKENTVVEISGSNPKRLDVLAVYQLAGNGNVFSITQNFSFYYGGE